MFARTERLLLRPGWIEDAPALAAALGPRDDGSATAARPGLYGIEDARALLAQPMQPTRPRLLIFARGDGAPDLIGTIGLRDAAGGIALSGWIRPDRRNHGYATEAGRAMLGIADMLGLDPLIAGHALDDPAAHTVLLALGFRPSATRRARMVRTRHAEPAAQPLAA